MSPTNLIRLNESSFPQKESGFENARIRAAPRIVGRRYKLGVGSCSFKMNRDKIISNNPIEDNMFGTRLSSLEKKRATLRY